MNTFHRMLGVCRMMPFAMICCVALWAEEFATQEDMQDVRTRLETLEAVSGASEESRGLRWGGYGELHYNAPAGDSDVLDFHRFVLLGEYAFTDWISFGTELEIEHAFIEGGEETGELELEQAWVDFAIHPRFNVHAGVLLLPVGIINRYHEPPTFHGVERPLVDKVIIPSTWFESGAGVHGELMEGMFYELDVVAGLDATGFSGSSGIRGGRQKAFKSTAEDFALVGSLEYRGLPGLAVGGSFYVGNSAQDAVGLRGGTVGLLELDGRYRWNRLELRAEFAAISIADADDISMATGDVIGENLYGVYVEGAYNFLPHMTHDEDDYLAGFLRFERLDTQADVPGGLQDDDANDRTILTLGLTYKPIPDIAVKVDFQDVDNKAGTGVDQFNIGVGYQF